MKVQEIMERAGIRETGRAVAYIKDGLEEMNLISSENIVKGTVVSTTGTGIKTTADGNNDAIGGLSSIMWTTADEQVDAFATGTFGFQDEGMGSDHFTHTTTTGVMRFRTYASDYTTDGDNTLAIEAQSGQGTLSGYVWMPTVITLSPDTWYEYEITHKNVIANAKISIVSSTDTTTSVISDAICTTNTSETPDGSAHVGKIRGGDSPFTYTDKILFKTNSSASTAKIGVEIVSLTQSQVLNISGIALKPVNIKITDSNSGFGSFANDMKIFIDGSKMDTDKSTYAPLGYHTISSASSGTLTLNIDQKYFYPDHTGNSITVRGQTLNYMDIVKDKRYYNLPSEAIKITDIRVKNHLNTDDQWRSIPRMIGKPLNTDKDEI